MSKYQRKNKSDKHNTRKFNIGLLAILLIVALTSVTLFGCGTSVTVTVVGGTGSGEYAVGAEITITATVPEGKTFVEWQVDGNKVSDKAIYTFPVAGAITITAIFSGNPKSYTVAFNSNNGSAVDSQIVTEGEKATKPNDPLRLGYAFGGWFTDNESFLLEYKFQEAVNADAQLYAKWTVKQYAIAYSGLDGAQLDGKPLVHTYGADTIVGNPTKTGFAFDGWSVNGSSDKVSNLVLGATAYTNDINLTANWVVNAYTITYRGLEKAELLVKPLSHSGGTATPVGNPTKVGYTFEGWFVNESRDKIKDLVLGATDYTDNITLFAIWTPNKYAITYVLDGGIAGANAPTTHTYGAITGLVSPTKEGYTFVGWNDGGNIVSSILDAKAYTADITLTAVYTLNTPTATLTADRNNIAYDGKDFTLTASATHTIVGATYTYAWYKDGSLLVSTASSFAVKNVSDSGKYSVKVTAKVGAHSSDATAELTLMINRAQVDVSLYTFADLTVVYDGQLHSVTVSNLDALVAVAYADNTLTDVGVKTASATFTLTDTANYEFKNSINTKIATLTVNKAQVDVSLYTFADLTVVYDGQLHSVIVSNLDALVTVAYADNTLTNAGVKTASVTFTLIDTANYEFKDSINTKTAILTVKKAEVDVHTFTFANLTTTYDGTEHKLEASNISPLVTVSYYNNTLTNAGEIRAEAAFTLKDTANYAFVNNTDGLTARLKVEPRKVTVTINDVTNEYGKPVIPNLPYVVSDNVIVGDDLKITLFTEVNIYSIVGIYDISGESLNRNYKVTFVGQSGGVKGKYTVIMATPTYTAPTFTNVYIGQMMADSMLIGGVGDGAFSIDNKVSFVSGVNNVSVTFKPTDNNYNSVNFNVSVTPIQLYVTLVDDTQVDRKIAVAYGGTLDKTAYVPLARTGYSVAWDNVVTANITSDITVTAVYTVNT